MLLHLHVVIFGEFFSDKCTRLSEINSVHPVYLCAPVGGLVCMYVVIAFILACSIPGDSFVCLRVHRQMAAPSQSVSFWNMHFACYAASVIQSTPHHFNFVLLFCLLLTLLFLSFRLLSSSSSSSTTATNATTRASPVVTLVFFPNFHVFFVMFFVFVYLAPPPLLFLLCCVFFFIFLIFPPAFSSSSCTSCSYCQISSELSHVECLSQRIPKKHSMHRACLRHA